MAPRVLPQSAVLVVTVVAVVGAFRAPRPGLAPRPRSQYSLYDDIRCTGDGEPPQCDLPMEVVCNIFDYANFTCAMCEKKLCPWTIKEGWKHTYLCSRACFKETCIFQ